MLTASEAMRLELVCDGAERYRAAHVAQAACEDLGAWLQILHADAGSRTARQIASLVAHIRWIMAEADKNTQQELLVALEEVSWSAPTAILSTQRRT